uniref:RecQ-mediated genome instability protein 1 n=1 Tax=Parastrongyloides trichosuri TaxID=131310 RepID=A0A0N5A527_PARTI
MSEYESAKNYFNDLQIKPRRTWLLQAFDENIKMSLFQNWIFSDISESTIPTPLPILKDKGGHFIANHILQLNCVKRIDVSFYSQYLELTEKKVDLTYFYEDNGENDDNKKDIPKTKENISKTRCLLLDLSDGKNIYEGIESEIIDTLSISTLPGTKIQLKGLIYFQKNILYLKKSNVEVIGGNIKSLAETNSTLKVIEKLLKIESLKENNDVKVESKENIKKDDFNISIISPRATINVNAMEKIIKNNKEMVETKNDKIMELDENVLDYSFGSFGYLEPIVESPTKKSLDNVILKDKNNINDIEKSIAIITNHVETNQKEFSQNENLHKDQRISLTIESEHNILNKTPFENNLVMVTPKNTAKNHDQITTSNNIFKDNENKHLPICDMKNKDVSRKKSSFFDDSIIQLKKKRIEDINSTYRFDTIQSAKEYSRFSFSAYKAIILGSVSRIMKELTVEGSVWSMEFLITDGTESNLFCSLHNDVIQEFLGMSAIEGVRLKKSDKTKQKEDAKSRLQFMVERLKRKNLVFSVEIFESERICPVITKIQTLEEFNHLR